MRTAERSTVPTERGGGTAPTPETWLAYLFAPISSLTKRIKITREGRRSHNPRDILLPQGYVAEVVTTDLNAPVHCCFDDQGYCYISEGGHKIDSVPRIVKVDVRTGAAETFFELPRDRWIKTGALTGACWHEGHLYFMNTDTLSRLTPDGGIEDIVTGLPGQGDHQANCPTVGPDGKIYFGVGTATNSGVVGPDNYAYEWLPEFRDVHDVPGQDVTLSGRNYEYRDVLGSLTGTVRTGAFVPYGMETVPGQVVKGDVKCTGSILRCDPDGSNLELVAWGLRNPYGTAFHPDGRMFATEHGMDERGLRYILGDTDDLYEIRQGAWYGWPDFAAGIRLDDPYWGGAGHGREQLLAEHPEPDPPKPFLEFPAHAAANGLDFCRDASFGFEGDAFVALFGDLAPITARSAVPVGFKVARVDMQRQRLVDFAVNKIAGPASKLPHDGFERPSHCQFGPDGALYVVDWGEIQLAPERGGVRMKKQTGTLWRIRRTATTRGEEPPVPVTVPFYAVQYLLWGLGLFALGATVGALFRRLHRGRRR